MAEANFFLEKVIHDFQNLDPKALFELIKFKFKGFAREMKNAERKNERSFLQRE